jgi:hypothetical protein
MVLFFFPERADAMAAVDGTRKEPMVQKEPSVTSVYTGESSSAGAAGRMKTPEVLGGALFYASYSIKKCLVLLAVFGVTFCLLTHRRVFCCSGRAHAVDMGHRKGKDVINLGDVPGGSRNPPTASAGWKVPSTDARLPNVGTVPTGVLAGSSARAVPLKAAVMGSLKGDFFASF